MLEPTTINLGAATLLYKMLEDIIYDNSVSPRVEREFNFNVKYKLQRNISLLEKDFLKYEEIRTKYIREYGEEQGDSIVVKEENAEKFKEVMREELKAPISHKFIKFTPEEINEFKIPSFSNYEMSLFMLALVDDKDFKEELTGVVEEEREEDTSEQKIDIIPPPTDK